ncbi:tubulin-tyrosine ligase family-domain-containing protein [Rhodocollybia butyracea]|uniref:Tubulin-tyrosine ligase family-domain-containing protein n=1 Tax=Rhodocollybia butyracea TaxID=206335 RepID=A0A9P5PTZ5_9AGAR|nr:tubulin-tyrosine ligase family-domain-containing protein [Rhodocollybia butyracea]
MKTAAVIWPSAPLTESLVRRALEFLETPVQIVTSTTDLALSSPLVQWSSYDEIEHELTKQECCLQSSYIIRKSLIRKHFLSRSIFSYLTKHPDSILKSCWPRTYEIEISFADELDELFADELWELGKELELESGPNWWILKPGMADRGNGIRLFNSRESLERVLEEFEETENGIDDGEELEENNTAVVISQLRHFVIQEYVLDPLLFDPREVSIGPDATKPSVLQAHKFHLRVYCVASGALTLYLYNRVLALFSSLPYSHPDPQDEKLDLAPHLTNTSLQTHRGEEGVRLLDELVGCHILSTGTGTAEPSSTLTPENVSVIISQIAVVLADTFKAGLENPVNLQALPNAFELFGVDFLVVNVSDRSDFQPQVKLLEINAEPAIELTGRRLAWILEDLFVDIAKICVEPFFESGADSVQVGTASKKASCWPVGETRRNMVKCLETEIRRHS